VKGPKKCGSLGCLAGAEGINPVGDAASGPIRLAFNSQLRFEFRGATVTSDVGQLLPRELDERLGLDGMIERHLTDPPCFRPIVEPEGPSARQPALSLDIRQP